MEFNQRGVVNCMCPLSLILSAKDSISFPSFQTLGLLETSYSCNMLDCSKAKKIDVCQFDQILFRGQNIPSCLILSPQGQTVQDGPMPLHPESERSNFCICEVISVRLCRTHLGCEATLHCLEFSISQTYALAGWWFIFQTCFFDNQNLLRGPEMSRVEESHAQHSMSLADFMKP